MKDYVFKIRLAVVTSIEAESHDEAIRILEGVLEADVSEVIIYDGTEANNDDELACTRLGTLTYEEITS